MRKIPELLIYSTALFILIKFSHSRNSAENSPSDPFWGAPFKLPHSSSEEKIAEKDGSDEAVVQPAPSDFSKDSGVLQLKKIDLEMFCFGNGNSFPLGPCSSTFLKCAAFNANSRVSFGECPMGSVFVKKACKPARRVRDCFLPQVNLLNDATEKLAKAVDFCAHRKPFEPALYIFDGPQAEDKCSRQALLCRGSAAAPLAISCPPGKTLDLSNMTCVKLPEQCALVSGPASTPIRAYLLQMLCEGSDPMNVPTLPLAMQTRIKTTEERCRNWYAVCGLAQLPELVFCDNGKMFDPSKGLCRRILPEDQCPHLGACRGWEWRMSAVGDCRPEFLFCNGMRPRLFQCERQGEVFKEGECVSAKKAECDVCQQGELKRSTDKCEEFFVCERETSLIIGNGNTEEGRTRWRQYVCSEGKVFQPERKECVPASEFRCPTKTQCKEKDSYSVECGDFFLCVHGHYVAGKCPQWTRWDANGHRCVYAKECHRFQEQQKISGGAAQKCVDGQIRPSADCKHFDECRSGAWHSRSCQEYASDRLKDPCRFCLKPAVATGKHQQEEQKNSGDYYPLERLLPEGFNSFHAKDGVKKRHCVEGEKIVNRHDCTHFMECLDGDWFNLACPQGHFFSARTQSCALTSSTNSSAAPKCQDLDGFFPLAGSGTSQQKKQSLHLLPIYSSPNNAPGIVPPGAGPLPVFKDSLLRANYEGTFDFCTAKSPSRVSNPYDCTKYRECALDHGGYYMEKECAVGMQFDPALLQCKYDYTCKPATCTTGLREPLLQCGRAKECREGSWQEFECANGMAFVAGKCSDTLRCQSTNPIVTGGQCSEGHAVAHPKDCSKYLLCRFGQFLEENCHLGHRFNAKLAQCDPKYDCPPAYRPPCYEGEIRAVNKGSIIKEECTTDYEICREGQFHRQSCPYGEHFAQGKCVSGICGGQNGGAGKYTKTGAAREKCQEAVGPQGFRANRQNCAKFYQCANGKWVPKDCATGTVFNPALGACDWPSNVPSC